MRRFAKDGIKESAVKAVFGTAAVFSVFAVFAIVGYILYASLPAFREIGFFNFVFGKTWAPTKEFLDVTERFGILPMISGTLCATVGALIAGGITGIFVAVFTVWFCPKRMQPALERIIDLLAGIPSIIYGFFGLSALVPLLAQISPNGSGKGLLAVSIILGLMILPTVAGIAKDGLRAVPRSYMEGALALGASKEQAVFKVVVPAARSGLVSSVVLGMGRAIGETMAVMMIAGNAVIFPEGLFGSFRTLTANIVTEMAYSTGLHRNALIATGFILLLFVLLLNGGLTLFKSGKKRERKRKIGEASVSSPIYRKSRAGSVALKYVAAALSALVIGMLVFLVVFILVKGLPHITWDLLFGESGNGHMTLRPAFASTGLLIVIALAIALPLGISAAIFLSEYSKKGSKLVKVIRLFTDTLAGIPSIVFGLFGMIVFCEAMGLGYSLLSGGLTLALIILPTVIRSTEESLISVSDSLREGSFALGAGKVRTIFRIVLPCAMRGIITAIILSVGRIVGESAALIYTIGAVPYQPQGILDQGSSFAVMMWLFAGEGLYIDNAYATASVLLILVAALNGAVALIGRKKKPRKRKKDGKRELRKAEVTAEI